MTDSPTPAPLTEDQLIESREEMCRAVSEAIENEELARRAMGNVNPGARGVE